MATITTAAFSEDEYFEILEKSEIKLEYHAGEIYTMWREPLEYRDGVLVTAESGLALFSPTMEILALSGAKPDHNLIVMNLAGEFFHCLKKQGCAIYSSDQRVNLKACEKYVFPDLVIVCEKRIIEKTGNGLEALANPGIIIEVLSESTESYDRGEKYECYQTLESLQEYVLVSVKKRKIEVFARNTPFEWIQRIYNDENSLVKIGNCEVELAEIYRMVTFDTAN